MILVDDMMEEAQRLAAPFIAPEIELQWRPHTVMGQPVLPPHPDTGWVPAIDNQGNIAELCGNILYLRWR